jgi:hypothetical protein
MTAEILHRAMLAHEMLADEMLDYEMLGRARPAREPFEYLVVPGFVPREAALAAAAAFPGPSMPGVLPAPDHPSADAFGDLLRALRNPRLSSALGAKFDLPLTPDRLMVTLRARTRPIDGRIHTDSETKLATALIYLNGDWSDSGGRLRLLRGRDDIEDMIAEVPPMAGTLLAFRRSDRSWHVHKPFDGERRAIMLNWMTDAATARRELRRHTVSAGIKRLFGQV